MKTLRNAKDKEEIERRLQKITPSSQRQWGKMSAHQMVCHVSDAFRMYMGEKEVGQEAVPVPRPLLKWTTLWAPIPWPKGFKTAPALDQQSAGSAPRDFDVDTQELRELLHRFCAIQGSFQWPAHPHFGRMSETEWMRLAYLHTSHHLRQFGA